MTLVALPDHIAALNLRLRSFAEIAALVGSADGYTQAARAVDRAKPRISPVIQDFWRLPAHAMLLRKAGGPSPDRDARVRSSRVDVWYFGPGEDAGTQEREAYRLWRTAHPALFPTSTAESESFVAANCRVYAIREEADPFPFVDADTGWRVMVGPILVDWSEAPA